MRGERFDLRLLTNNRSQLVLAGRGKTPVESRYGLDSVDDNLAKRPIENRPERWSIPIPGCLCGRVEADRPAETERTEAK